MSLEAAKLRELLAISRAITSRTNYAEILDLVARKACTFAAADTCVLLLANPGAPATIAASAGVVPVDARERRIVLDEQLDASLRERFELGAEDHMLAVPMLLRGEVRGSLVVFRRWKPGLEPPPALRAEHEALLSLLADQAAIALEHATLCLSEAKFSRIISISADAMISIDEHQRITMFNEGASEIFGYTKDEALGAPLDILIPERFRAGHRGHVDRFSAGPDLARAMGERRSRIFGLRKSGEEFPAEAAISKLEAGGEKVLTVALRDITEHVRIQNDQKFLADVGALLASTLEYEDTLTGIARLAVRDLADCVVVDIVDRKGDVQRLKVLHRDPAKTALSARLERLALDRRRRHLASEVLDTRRPFLMSEVAPSYLGAVAQSEEHREALEELAPTSLLAVPLLAKSRFPRRTRAHLFRSDSPVWTARSRACAGAGRPGRARHGQRALVRGGSAGHAGAR